MEMERSLLPGQSTRENVLEEAVPQHGPVEFDNPSAGAIGPRHRKWQTPIWSNTLDERACRPSKLRTRFNKMLRLAKHTSILMGHNVGDPRPSFRALRRWAGNAKPKLLRRGFR